MLGICTMRVKQSPYAVSALAMLGGLYLLAGPFQEDHSDPARLLPLWGLLLFYEALVIGMIAFLRRQEIETVALRVVSLLFLADPLFFGDAFSGASFRTGLEFNGAAMAVSLAKAWALARASDYKVSPWLAGWVAGAFGFVHLFPTLIAVPAARPGQFNGMMAGVAWASAFSVPLLRTRKIGRVAVAAMALHALVSGGVHGIPFEPTFVIPPLVAAACLLPWPTPGWAPLAAAALLTPLRSSMTSFFSTRAGVGAALVAASFALLAAGFLRSLNGKTPEVARANPRERLVQRG